MLTPEDHEKIETGDRLRAMGLEPAVNHRHHLAAKRAHRARQERARAMAEKFGLHVPYWAEEQPPNPGVVIGG